MRKIRYFIGAIFAASLIFSSQSAFASNYDWAVVVHVTLVEPTYMPANLDFQIDAPAGSCPVGTYLFWNVHGSDEASQIANTQAVLSTLITAEITGRPVQIFGNNPTSTNSNCTVSYIHM